MSLLDALLLDPAPFYAWISYRTDGIKDSGTAADPWDGSTAARFDARMSELPPYTRLHLGANPKDSDAPTVIKQLSDLETRIEDALTMALL